MSPVHVWHLLSVTKSVQQALDYIRSSPIVAGKEEWDCFYLMYAPQSHAMTLHASQCEH